MQEKTAWPKEPRAKSTFIALLRQFVVQEYSAERLYRHIQSLADVNSTSTMEFLLRQADAKQPHEGSWEAFSTILRSQSANATLPFASSIHRFLKVHDITWYTAFDAVCEADK